MFDIIQHLTKFKTSWHKLPTNLQKEFNVFILHKFLATNFNQIDLANELQQYTTLTNEQVYTIYLKKLPKYVQLNFIKKNKKTLSKDLIQFVANIVKKSKKDVEEFILNLSEDDFVKFFKNYGVDDKTIKKWKKEIQ